MADESPVTAAASSVKRQSAIEMSKALFDSGITASPVVDRAASWLLVGIGAAITLLIGNIESTVAIVGPEAFKWLLMSLLVGALFGIAEKGLAAMVQTQAHVLERLERALPEINEDHKQRMNEIQNAAEAAEEVVDAGLDIETPIKELESIVPWYNKAKFRKRLQQGFGDPLMGRKHAARLYNRQIVYAVAEVAVSAWVVVLVAWTV